MFKLWWKFQWDKSWYLFIVGLHVAVNCLYTVVVYYLVAVEYREGESQQPERG